MPILQENDLDKFVKEEVKEPEEVEAKTKHKKDMIIAKIIIANSIKDNLIPQVSSMETPKEMFDALSRLFEGRNINKKMTLINQLKSVRAQKSETMQSYFTRVAQIKDQLEAIGDMVEEAEVVMTTLNGLPRDWEAFIRGICSRRKLTKFRKLWEECVQEEDRIADKEEKLNDNEYQTLNAHTKGKERVMIILLRLKGLKDLREISQALNASTVIS